MPDLAEKMARLYVLGPPGVRGNWNEAAKAAGYSRPPRENNQKVWRAIEEAAKSIEENPVEDFFGNAANLSWEELADKARPLLAKIAAGEAYATPQQLAALREIITRGEGKAGALPQDEHKVGVVVLPALGEGKQMQICPRCLSELAKELTEAE